MKHTALVLSNDEVPTIIKDSFNVVDKIDNNWIDVCIAIGGDGTVLKAFRKLSATAWFVPIVGINTGHLGFLSNNIYIDKFIELYYNGIYTKTIRDTIAVFVDNHKTATALNEVVIYNSNHGSLANIDITILGKTIKYHCDALIISTATGSTAYNLSAGGSIVHPMLNVISLTPVAPFSMSARPLIVPKATLRISCDHDFIYVVDGIKCETALPKESVLDITDTVQITTLHFDYDFTSLIQDKLGWNTSLKFK